MHHLLLALHFRRLRRSYNNREKWRGNGIVTKRERRKLRKKQRKINLDGENPNPGLCLYKNIS